jgi:hypothetical protein
VLLQETSPLGHAQLPPRHCSPPLQAVPHVPQFVRSDLVSTQLDPHFVRPGSQVVWQSPLLQTSPPAVLQVFPQIPQFAGSVDVSVQVAPHVTEGDVHGVTPPSLPPSVPPSPASVPPSVPPEDVPPEDVPPEDDVPVVPSGPPSRDGLGTPLVSSSPHAAMTLLVAATTTRAARHFVSAKLRML